MKVLVIGSGAREHAIVWKCVQSDLVERVFCAPGNGGTGGMARNIAIAPTDVVRLVSFAKQERLGLVILGPEAAVEAGAGDALRDAGVPVLGPGREAGRIESKSGSKGLSCRCWESPTAPRSSHWRPPATSSGPTTVTWVPTPVAWARTRRRLQSTNRWSGRL